MTLLTTARFHTTVAALHQLPRDGLVEVAFVGRSNAGKSSAINVLCNRKRLAFSSRTPGRTQALNYFAVGPADRAVAYVVDTPGYGYASAPSRRSGPGTSSPASTCSGVRSWWAWSCSRTSAAASRTWTAGSSAGCRPRPN